MMKTGRLPTAFSDWVRVLGEIFKGATLGPNDRILRQQTHHQEGSPPGGDDERPSPVDDLRCC